MLKYTEHKIYYFYLVEEDCSGALLWVITIIDLHSFWIFSSWNSVPINNVCDFDALKFISLFFSGLNFVHVFLILHKNILLYVLLKVLKICSSLLYLDPSEIKFRELKEVEIYFPFVFVFFFLTQITNSSSIILLVRPSFSLWSSI